VDARSGGAGRGSVFTVWLPLSTTGLSAAEKKPANREFKVKTVVVVEDQEDARRMMEILLDSKGLKVESAGDGLAGAELIERIKPDLALVDLGLPKLNGFDLARRIRHNSATADMRLIALSGYGQESDVKAALEAGFDDHLTKPPDFDRLDELIAKPGNRPH
jgi:DNA-binding response OmpR family regulator